MKVMEVLLVAGNFVPASEGLENKQRFDFKGRQTILTAFLQ